MTRNATPNTPRPRALPPTPPFPDDARRALRDLCDAWLRAAPAKIAAASHRLVHRPEEPRAVTSEELAEVIARLSDPAPWTAAPEPTLARLHAPVVAIGSELAAFLARPDLHPAHVARLLRFVDGDPDRLSVAVSRALAPRVGVVEIADALDCAGYDARNLLVHPYWAALRDDDLAVLFAARPDMVEIAFGWTKVEDLEIPSYNELLVRKLTLRALERMPAIPPSLEAPLFRMALEGRLAERPAAQNAASKIPGWEARAVAALEESSFETRAAAARWLGRARVAAARAPLLAKVRTEKNEAARAAMMDALQLLGEPLDASLSREALVRESEAILKKLAPPAWLDVDRLPPLAWADTGARVEPVVVHAWIAAAHKARSPAPRPLLRMYARGLRAEDAERFASALLDAWIAQDTAAPKEVTPENEARLRHEAGFMHGWLKCTEEEAYARLRATHLATPVGSAIADKGLLAVVAALGARGIGATVGAYLKTWYGNRAAQCKALVEMLAWVDDRAATQLLLATATRFRTAGIRAEAEKQAKELADRRGWTVDELADRTIPTAGLDDDGTLEIVYGRRDGAPDAEGHPTLTPTRTFTARIDEKMSLALSDASGVPVKTLPDARKDEDDDTVKGAKQDFARAKKELAGIIKAQRERLYAAMCTQRSWRFEDWDAFLHRHPIARHLCMGVVWTATTGEATMAFRPLGDGALSSAHHDDVKLPPDAVVRVAHGSLLTAGEIAAWSEHLGDFKVLPLFPQLLRPAYPLDEARARATEIDAFVGHMIDSFVLRGRATALGYTRGPAEDGGWYFRYEKAFPSLGLAAVLAFSGAPLPEEKRLVALRSLSFEERTASGSVGARALGEVPAVLIAEAYADLADIAAAGSGFDPSWESKV